MEDEQLLVSRLLHQLGAEDPQQHFAILCAVRAHLERGGARRAKHTFPALAFCGLEVGWGAWPRRREALALRLPAWSAAGPLGMPGPLRVRCAGASPRIIPLQRRPQTRIQHQLNK
jgi:hypothetical protein